MNQRLKHGLLHGLIAVVIASVGAVICAMGAIWGSATWFEHLYPHDGQNSLGAFVVGLIALPVAWVVLFIAVFAWLWWRGRNRLPIEEHREEATR